MLIKDNFSMLLLALLGLLGVFYLESGKAKDVEYFNYEVVTPIYTLEATEGSLNTFKFSKELIDNQVVYTFYTKDAEGSFKTKNVKGKDIKITKTDAQNPTITEYFKLKGSGEKDKNGDFIITDFDKARIRDGFIRPTEIIITVPKNVVELN